MVSDFFLIDLEACRGNGVPLTSESLDVQVLRAVRHGQIKTSK